MNVNFNDVSPGMILFRNWKPNGIYFLVIAVTNDKLWYIVIGAYGQAKFEHASWHGSKSQFTHIDQIILNSNHSQ